MHCHVLTVAVRVYDARNTTHLFPQLWVVLDQLRGVVHHRVDEERLPNWERDRESVEYLGERRIVVVPSKCIHARRESSGARARNATRSAHLFVAHRAQGAGAPPCTLWAARRSGR